MDSKTFLAVFLSLLVIIAYQYLLAPQLAPQKQQPAPVKTQEAPAPAATASSPSVSVPSAPPAEEREVRVENDLFTAVFSSRGGTVKFWQLKSYRDKGKEVILLKKPGTLPALAIGGSPDFNLASANFTVSGGDLKLDGNNKTGSIIFEYSENGVTARRTYTFYNDRYEADLTDEVSGLPEYWISLGSDFGIFDHAAGYTHVGPALLRGTDLEEIAPNKLKEPKVFKDGTIKWIAQEDKYFFSSLLPGTPVDEAKVWIYKDSPVIALKGKAGVNKFHLYAGPKEPERLAKLDSLQYVINYGFFSVIARPLFWILRFFHSFAGNWGWAIILLTVVVRIPFIPLVSKGQRSMKKLQEIQPKMNEIREKYKKDPQKMQAEMMQLYKKYKVNPMGGCLPMVLQIPVFFALYKVLLISIELRGAPFMLWITDLSGPDTLFGHIPAWFPLIGGFALGPLPIVMGITMVLQQKMTPSSMDPKQAKMMMLMPVIFTFMFLNFASGLVLYWLVNNVLSIGQQFYINKTASKTATPA